MDFVVVGAHRTGTTWLYENLYHHPEIQLSKKRKELHFFDRDANYNQGIGFYNTFFKISSDKKRNGDITPSYLSHKIVPKRMFACFPDTKIIIILRNLLTDFILIYA